MPNLEWDCDADLKPYVENGQLEPWNAMAVTTVRAVTKINDRLNSLEKKMTEREQTAVNPNQVPLVPRYV